MLTLLLIGYKEFLFKFFFLSQQVSACPNYYFYYYYYYILDVSLKFFNVTGNVIVIGRHWASGAQFTACWRKHRRSCMLNYWSHTDRVVKHHQTRKGCHPSPWTVLWLQKSHCDTRSLGPIDTLLSLICIFSSRSKVKSTRNRVK